MASVGTGAIEVQRAVSGKGRSRPSSGRWWPADDRPPADIRLGIGPAMSREPSGRSDWPRHALSPVCTRQRNPKARRAPRAIRYRALNPSPAWERSGSRCPFRSAGAAGAPDRARSSCAGWPRAPARSACHHRGPNPRCVFRSIVTAGFGIVTGEFGIVTAEFEIVTEGLRSLH